MTKSDREAVRMKYNGLCAYTGKPLGEDWQVDHITPMMYCRIYGRKPNEGENLVPSLRIVNHYKRAKGLDEFRGYMLSFHSRLAKMPYNTKREKTIKRKEYMFKVAEAFDISIIDGRKFSGVFYFETLIQQP